MIIIETSQAGLQWIRDNMPSDLYIVLKELKLDMVVVGVTNECFNMMEDQEYPYYFKWQNILRELQCSSLQSIYTQNLILGGHNG